MNIKTPCPNNRDEQGKYERIAQTLLVELERNRYELRNCTDKDEETELVDEIMAHVIDQNDMYQSEICKLQTIAEDFINRL